ncbi:MAG: mannose-6-phosphate isomerase, class I [Planctomycetes bacterium]|nr:mannose-6-phosphate isomerase, class I [Planctomycetota bacterium]
MNQPPASSQGTAPARWPGLLPLKCYVQHYAWGDPRFIPALLGLDNPGEEPFAELWMGAHSDLPSEVVREGKLRRLDELIPASAEAVLGPTVAGAFQNRLPYLFKVLSAASPLSIQIHPSKQSAEEGYRRENKARVSLSAPTRNYRDDNHKPELIAALTDFHGLRGFRPLAKIAQVLDKVPEFRQLAPDFEPTPESLRAFYRRFMSLPQDRVDAVLDPLVERLQREEGDNKQRFTRNDREYWVLRADRASALKGHRDRGLLSIYLLNLVHLEPNEAMQLPAGVLHAYLEGSGVEIMANSNNVIRGGLTEKHVDVPELLNNATFEGGPAEVLRATQLSDTEWGYATSFREFKLSRIEVDEARTHENGGDHSAEILLCIAADPEARATVASDEESLSVSKGGVVLVCHGTAYTIETLGRATLFKATVPVSPAADQTVGNAE